MDLDGGDPAAGHYNDTNRAFLQSFIARGTLTLEEGKKLLAAIFTAQDDTITLPADVTEEDFNSYISAAADVLSAYDYEIRSTQHQVSKTRVHALVNSQSDPITQLATTRTPEEILYIKRLLDGMFETFNRPGKEIMAITGLQAGESRFRKGSGRVIVGDGSQSIDKGVTQEQVEKLLVRLEKENWLERSKAGFYSLSPRALMELRNWLLDTYNDSDDPDEWQRIKSCEACKDIVTIGQRCSRLECHARLHNICETAYFKSRPAKKCPRCSTPWAGSRFVGEKAVTTTEDYLKGKRRSGGAKRAREEVEEEAEQEDEQPAERRRKGGHVSQTQTAVSDEEEEEEEQEEEEEEEEEPQPKRPAARNQKGTKATQVESSEDEDAEDDDDDDDE